MTKAKEMVELSSMVAAKIKEKKGDITDDEVNKFFKRIFIKYIC